MADNAQQPADDKSLEKAVWHYVSVGTLWIALILSGMALERLGLTTWVFSGILPGQVGSLRTQLTECERNFGEVKFARDIAVRQEDTLRVEIEKLQDKVSTLEDQIAASAQNDSSDKEL